MNRKSVLIVEDELIISEMLLEIIKEFGCGRVEQATSYSEALIALAGESWDLVFLDVNLGDRRDGIDLADLIRRKYKTPFIFLTSYGDKDTIFRAAKTSPEAYLTKPFKASDIFASMQLVFAKHESIRSLRFKEGYSEEEVGLDQVLFMKADNIYVELYTEDRKFLIRSTLESFLGEHDYEELVRVHRSYAINIGKVSSKTSHSVIIGDHEVPVSRKYRMKVNELLINDPDIPINP